ncbi:Tropomodulin [Caenorhabditis elegans]|uniref:Tropomodulin n=1 Tax=Caenorhabditis elegans TaxID=6239 RepID=Q8I7M7_CAEEL|nr:Tropomodulin [Caenorhabditis elegans]CCD63654.1 Tropomodulin [Caenorhabditis elegans]|eukprot:NP_872143.2 TropoMoDulin [Caenorhabditis elegans]
MEEELQQLRTNASSDLMTDEDFIATIESMGVEAQEREINDLLKAMHENRIVSWDEAERILMETDQTPIKCSLPEQTRPTEPENEVDVDQCIKKLLDNDPSLKEINLNNMKRTPVPAIKRLLEALAYNEHCERISLANMGLYDHDINVLVTVIEMNQAIKKVNLETNYLSGDFFSKLFKAALVNESVEEIKAVNQGVSFSTQSEKEIIDAIVKNHGLTKISINFRLPEGRHKVENATLRNGELKRVKRREAAQKARLEAEELAKNPVPKLAPEPKKEPEPKKMAPKIPPAVPKSLVSPEPKPSLAPKAAPVIATAPPKSTILMKQLSFQRASRESEEDTEFVPPPAVPEPPKKLAIPKTFMKKEETPSFQKVAKRPTRQWEPKKQESLEQEEHKETVKEEVKKEEVKEKVPAKVERKHWEPKVAPAPVIDGYAPILDVSGNAAPSTAKPKLDGAPIRAKRPPITAKNIWEQRMAKIEKKEEKKKPLLSIQKIREMEKNDVIKKEEDDRLEQLLKKEKEPKKLNNEHRKLFENGNVAQKKPEPRRHVQKLIAKKPNSILNQTEPTKIEGPDKQETRPTTVIRRTVIRKKEEMVPSEKPEVSENEKPKRRLVRKKKVVEGDGMNGTNGHQSHLTSAPPQAVH